MGNRSVQRSVNRRPESCVPLERFQPQAPVPLAPFKFDKTTQEWIEVQETPPKSIQMDTLKIITFNVWFSNWRCPERFEELCSIMEKMEADIICLQEVTANFLKHVSSISWVRKDYYMSDWNGEFVGDYGVCILSKQCIQRLFYLVLPTQMGRNSVVAQYTFNEEIFKCSTVHLESLDTSPYRKKQLEIISQELNSISASTSILLGDFNFDASCNFSHHLKKRDLYQQNIQITPAVEEEIKKASKEKLENDNLAELLPHHQDVWHLLHKSDPGYTYDSEKNEMVKQLNGYEQMRYDRVLLRSKRWIPRKICLLGTERIDKVSEESIYPSDHFGLLVELAYSKPDM